ncbi:hypothetical protein HY631_01835 [Candidatus Uhrbacteria bacterium]|nr:hypothetical protein [Candidatus Uhrbacteria bacterium]
MKDRDRKKLIVGREAVTRLLQKLEDAAIEASELFEQWAHRRPYRLDPEDRLAEERLAQQRAFRQRTKYLRRKKLIKTKRTEVGLFYELTQEGRVELFERLVKQRRKLPEGEVCLVMYDVPIEGNLGRDALRYFLKRVGFRQAQKSVWQTDRDVVSEVQKFVRSAKIQKWVDVYLAKKM